MTKISIDLIRVPEVHFRSNPSIDEEFKASLQRGQIQPIVVREIEGGFHELVCGYRRLLGLKAIGRRTIECKVMNLTYQEAAIMTVQENQQHEQANPMDLADYIQHRFIEELKMAHVDIAEALEINVSKVSSLLRLRDEPLVSQKVKEEGKSLQWALEVLSAKPKEGSSAEEFDEWKQSFVDKSSASVGDVRKMKKGRIMKDCPGCHGNFPLKEMTPVCSDCLNRLLKIAQNKILA